MAVVQIALLLVAVALVFGWLKYRQNFWRSRGIVHNRPQLLRGNLGEFGVSKQLSLIFGETYAKFKGQAPFAGFNFLMTNTPVILDLDLIKNILIKDFANFTARGLYHNEKDDPLTANLFFMDGEKWRIMRHKMSPTFTSGKMKQMFGTVVDVGQELIQVLSEKVGTKKEMEITDILARYTADVIGTCAFGLECNSLRNEKAEFVEMGKLFINNPRHMKFIDGLINSYPDWARKLHMRVIRDDVHEFYMRITRDTIAYREQNNIKRNDFMDMMIEMKNSKDGLTVEEIAAQSFVFFIAGYETSSTTMGFALYQLAKHEAIQQKVREEVIEVLLRHGGKFGYEAMKEMHYLDKVIDETLRIHPVASHLIRRAQNRYETSNPKYTIEAGMMIVIPTMGIHFDPDIYPEPQRFDPERFTAEQIQSRHPCSYLPFGEGPRNCIGLRFGKMQAAIGLAYLVQNFKFSMSERTEDPPKYNVSNFILGAANGIHLNVEKIART